MFLTASHGTAYLDRIGVTQVRVTFNQDSTRGPYHYGTLITNPGCDPRGADPGDLAVIVLDDVGEEITPARLPSTGQLDAWFGAARRIYKDQKFTAVGYGVQGVETGGQAILTVATRYRSSTR